MVYAILKHVFEVRTSLVTQMVRRLPTMRETQVRSLGQEDPLEKEMAAHSSTLAWKIPWTEERGKLQYMGSRVVGHDWVTSLTRRKGFPGGSEDKESACNAEDLGSTPELGRSPGVGYGYLLKYSCLENSMDRGLFWATLHDVTKSWTWLRK